MGDSGYGVTVMDLDWLWNKNCLGGGFGAAVVVDSEQQQWIWSILGAKDVGDSGYGDTVMDLE